MPNTSENKLIRKPAQLLFPLPLFVPSGRDRLCDVAAATGSADSPGRRDAEPCAAPGPSRDTPRSEGCRDEGLQK